MNKQVKKYTFVRTPFSGTHMGEVVQSQFYDFAFGDGLLNMVSLYMKAQGNNAPYTFVLQNASSDSVREWQTELALEIHELGGEESLGRHRSALSELRHKHNLTNAPLQHGIFHQSKMFGQGSLAYRQTCKLEG